MCGIQYPVEAGKENVLWEDKLVKSETYSHSIPANLSLGRECHGVLPKKPLVLWRMIPAWEAKLAIIEHVGDFERNRVSFNVLWM